MHHIDVRIEKDVYDVNNTLATRNAEHLKAHGVRAFDLLGAIGSGKTALIERLVPLLNKKGLKAGAIAGDVYGDDDFKRIVALGIPAFNANTGKECHLDAHLVEHAIDFSPSMISICSSSRTWVTWSAPPISGSVPRSGSLW
jgi:hydrogenase nickel incorporation protein HypB